MAPNTQNQVWEPELDVLDVSAELETLPSIKVMSDTQQLAAAREQVRRLEEQLT
jgi:hypothetical protein